MRTNLDHAQPRAGGDENMKSAPSHVMQSDSGLVGVVA